MRRRACWPSAGASSCALEALGDPAELDVRAAVVVDGRQAADRRAGDKQNEHNEQTGREAKALHRTGL